MSEHKKKPELLAPAGNMNCLYAAFNAGADAVYLAGKEFGARASADNFSGEELIYAIELAHLHHKKIYLAFNTLIKEREWGKIHSFLEPLHKCGLDGIIIQDLGLIDYLGSEFPNLQIHASTQMTVTTPFSALLLKERGVSRVVPARELSLEEVIDIKNTGIEAECFIHGAMCYCYSGQCLFSSFLGGRSGNRGRCAGPCRLPYTISENGRYIKKDDIKYPLSLKDLCILPLIDRLIDAGIDSFKIEGRLKSPEYVAFTTSVYRKYIDMYCETGVLDVDKADMAMMSSMYVRTDTMNGYFMKHNDADMITKGSPAYNESEEGLTERINKKYVKPVKKLPVTGVVTLIPGHNASVILRYDSKVIECEGGPVDRAKNRPISESDVRKQLGKTGDAFFEFEKLAVEMDDDCFMPVRSLNEIRRKAFEMLKEEILYAH